jgi:hypothetical protein
MIIYVNNILIYGKSTEEIDNLIKRLKKDNIALHKEGAWKRVTLGWIYSRMETRSHYNKRGWPNGLSQLPWIGL